MPRPKRPRFVEAHPECALFTPENREDGEELQLSLEEYEALRLSDYLGHDQASASELMGISRQTFGRILRKARYILTAALVNGHRLEVTGGCYTMEQGGKGRRRCQQKQGDAMNGNGNAKQGRGLGRGRGMGRGLGQDGTANQENGTGQGRGMGGGGGQGMGGGRGLGCGRRDGSCRSSKVKE